MKRGSRTWLTVLTLSSVTLHSDLRTGPVFGNLSRTGSQAAESAAIQIEVICFEEADTIEKPTKREKPTKPEKPAKPYRISAKIPEPYHINVNEQSDCTLTVHYQSMTGSIPIVSEKDNVHYDLILSTVDRKLRVQRQ